jgi:hypothetical protein
MTMRTRIPMVWVVLIALSLGLFLVSCATYERQIVPFKMPAAYPNALEVAGAVIASKAYDDPKEAGQAFGFSIREAGVLPVQVIFDNKGSHPLEIVPEQTFLIDTDDNLWPILDSRLVYDRIAKHTELGQVMPEGAKSGMLGGAAGAIIGAAIGIVSGQNVGDAAMKGAAIGAAGGMVLGGGKGLTDVDVQRQIREDLRTRSLERRAITPGEVAYGFIFFPGEAKKSKELRLRLMEGDTKLTYPPMYFKF